MTNKQTEEVIREFREKFELHDLGKDEFTLCCNNDDGSCDGGISILKECQGEAERHLKNVEQFILTAIQEAEERGRKETQLQRVIRRSESGELAYGDVTIRVSICGLSMTRFCSVKDFEETLDDMKNLPIKEMKKKFKSK